MQFDFDKIIDRRGKDAVAVEGFGLRPGFSPGVPKEEFDVIPMWVADMNFETAPSIPEAIIERAKHPLYGYYLPREEYYDAITRWHEKRKGVEDLEREMIGYENGVLGGVMSALAVLCSKGDKVLLHSPTYIGFTASLENGGYHIVHSPLYLDDEGIYRMDYDDMEKKIVDNAIHAAIFCSPHNPTGRVWEREELERAMEIYRKHDVTVISDEIWSDILRKGFTHIPTQSVSEDAKERTIALYAPSKTFNLAGLIGSYHVIYNKRLRDRVRKESSLGHYNAMNLFSMYALIGAYSETGNAWVDEMLKTIDRNMRFAMEFIDERLDGVTYSAPQGTYMLLIDCSGYMKEHGVTLEEIEKAGWDVGVAWQDGKMFHAPTHIRINLALPLSRVREAFRRMEKYVFVKERIR